MITIEKAIEEIKAWQFGKGNPSYDKLNLALDLGIEALKREQLLRHEIPYDRDGLLPGESED